MKYVLALDQGTTSSRALLFDKLGTVRAVAQQEFDQIFPQPGWVEHNPEQIATSQIAVALLALSKAGLRRSDVAAIGIANQRETTIVWNRDTGQPIHNAIVWQDRRTADFCERLRSEGHSSMIQQRTGLLIDSYFSATKISWILDNVAGARNLAEAGKLAFGTVDSWLVWKLTHGAAPRHGYQQRLPQHAVQHSYPRLGSRTARPASHSRIRCCRKFAPQAKSMPRQVALQDFKEFPLPALPAISRPRSSASNAPLPA